MELMKEAEITDAETGRPIAADPAGGIVDEQSLTVQQLIRATDDLAALDKLDEVQSRRYLSVNSPELFFGHDIRFCH